MRRARGFLAIVVGLAAAGPVRAGPATDGSAPVARDAWAILAAARDELERAAWTADFVQSYLPAGFSSGEEESGRVSLALPGHLRWDYETPFPKVFLVRVDTAYSWNPGERSGRRAELGEEERRHLALLRLDLEELARRYAATATAAEDGVAVDLTPIEPDAAIRHARLLVDPDDDRLLAVRYEDVEGNATEFRLSGHRRLEATERFAPPDDVDWLED